MESKRLDNAALAAGISPSYINAHGKPQSIAAVTKQRLLDAMHRSTAATKVAVKPPAAAGRLVALTRYMLSIRRTRRAPVRIARLHVAG